MQEEVIKGEKWNIYLSLLLILPNITSRSQKYYVQDKTSFSFFPARPNSAQFHLSICWYWPMDHVFSDNFFAWETNPLAFTEVYKGLNPRHRAGWSCDDSAEERWEY